WEIVRASATTKRFKRRSFIQATISVRKSGSTPASACEIKKNPRQAVGSVGRMGTMADGQLLPPEPAAVLGVAAQFLLDAHKLVVLGDAIRSRRRAGLDLAAVGRHRDVRDCRILRLTRA